MYSFIPDDLGGQAVMETQQQIHQFRNFSIRTSSVSNVVSPYYTKKELQYEVVNLLPEYKQILPAYRGNGLRSRFFREFQID